MERAGEGEWKMNKQPEYSLFFIYIYIFISLKGFQPHKHLSVGGTSMLSVPAATRRVAAGRRPNKLISAAENSDNKVPDPALRQYVYIYIDIYLYTVYTCMCVRVFLYICILSHFHLDVNNSALSSKPSVCERFYYT